MPSSTASTEAGIVAVHRHQGFGSSAYAISHFALGNRHESGCTLLAPLKIASNERPCSMLTRSGSASRSSPPPRASSARSCARQSTSIATPAKKLHHTTRHLFEDIIMHEINKRYKAWDSSMYPSHDALHGIASRVRAMVHSSLWFGVRRLSQTWSNVKHELVFFGARSIKCVRHLCPAHLYTHGFTGYHRLNISYDVTSLLTRLT